MQSRFKGKCATTGRPFSKGTVIYYDTDLKAAYLPSEQLDKRYQEQNKSKSVADYIDAQECAMFERYNY
jgi:hypothetical protein